MESYVIKKLVLNDYEVGDTLGTGMDILTQVLLAELESRRIKRQESTLPLRL
jgi:hypothetical protein